MILVILVMMTNSLGVSANSALVVKFVLISWVAKLMRVGGAAKFLVQYELKARWF